MRRRNAQRFEGKVAKQRRRRAPAPAKTRKRTEENGTCQPPEPAPPKNAVDYTVLRPRLGEVEKWKGGKVERFAQSASTALGVESVLRKSLGREAASRNGDRVKRGHAGRVTLPKRGRWNEAGGDAPHGDRVRRGHAGRVTLPKRGRGSVARRGGDGEICRVKRAALYAL